MADSVVVMLCPGGGCVEISKAVLKYHFMVLMMVGKIYEHSGFCSKCVMEVCVYCVIVFLIMQYNTIV